DSVHIYHTCCGTSFRSLTVAENFTGGNGVELLSDSGGSNFGISFYDLSSGHAGSGKSNILITGNGGSPPTDATNSQINFYNTYSEFSTGVAITAVNI